ncbi:MAG: ORF6N domain-containing protein [Candidatus Margulisiibacteriota bacterium]
MNKLMPIERIENKIYFIRGQKVMIDSDLAKLYGVRTKNLNKAVSRNPKRFPADFMFQLTQQEHDNMRFQNGTSKRGGRRYQPYAFTEQGLAMLSSVLHSEKAAEVNIQIMRTFVKLRTVLATNKDLTYLFKELKHKVDRHDTEIGLIIKAIEKMIATEAKPKTKIGFITKKED